ncbi:hypothetical protein K435DRAFT_889686 [Dendrothele bispora CBS 962.96]|uniref:HNH nuclease domain-containing protein n=1 Tax=Dendrothele bispora (strain CBS 962.96) TaxID=1314807 RepID=A0A4V4HG22_DENBC|nr:hypothetical protein K435DRAFT_889686 [Dendrothele bispora CBS 962.96]
MDLVSARVIGYLLLYPLNHTSRQRVTTEVFSINRLYKNEVSEKVFLLGKMYIDHLICPFRGSPGRTPSSSQHVSRPSYDFLRDMIRETLVPYPTNHSQTKSNALIRDGFRCMVTRKLDLESVASVKDLGTLVASEWPKDPGTTTECAYIFPKSTSSGISGTTPPELQKLQCAASFWTILESFGYSGISQELNGQQVHQLGNVMTHDIGLHKWMDKLVLWFEEAADGVPNHYNVKIIERYETLARRHLSLPTDVTFTVDQIVQSRLKPDSPPLTGSELPLPNPKYLHIHASVCRIAHMSGAADYIDFIFRDMERLDVLAEDGASADVLAGTLSFSTALPAVGTALVRECGR